MTTELKSSGKKQTIHPILQLEVLPQNERHLVIMVEGQIRQETMESFKSHLTEIIDQEDPRQITLEFSKVDFIDSRGLAVIYELFRLSKSKKCIFEIINSNADIVNLFLLTRLHRLFTIR